MTIFVLDLIRSLIERSSLKYLNMYGVLNNDRSLKTSKQTIQLNTLNFHN